MALDDRLYVQHHVRRVLRYSDIIECRSKCYDSTEFYLVNIGFVLPFSVLSSVYHLNEFIA